MVPGAEGHARIDDEVDASLTPFFPGRQDREALAYVKRREPFFPRFVPVLFGYQRMAKGKILDLIGSIEKRFKSERSFVIVPISTVSGK